VPILHPTFREKHQRIEKVGVELIAPTNQALKAQKRRIWYPIWGESGHKGEFFNSLT
jgi:hypothetical protein